jgi:hypothetical protein
MDILNSPQLDEIYFINNKVGELVKLKIIAANLIEPGLIRYKYTFGYDSNIEESIRFGEVSVYAWNIWVEDSKMTKINNPQEGLAFILKHGCR